MLTALTALTTCSGCAAARWYLDRSSRRGAELFGGHVRLPSEVLPLASAAALGAVWAGRDRLGPIGAGLVLGGGLSNLRERLRRGAVYDYIQFPKAPGPLRRYVFDLADLAILAGGALCVRKGAKPRQAS